MSTPNTDPFDDSDPFADDLTPQETAEIERRMNINRLQNEAGELAGGQMTGFSSDEAPSEVLEQFWQNIVAFEKAPLVTMHQKLAQTDITLPPDGELDDANIHTKLWQIIRWLAEVGTVLEDTDHLSDRELYVWLRDDYFHEQVEDLAGWHASPVGSCDEDDMKIIFRYYADEDWRAQWAEDYPEFEMPPREKPPFDRDKSLPGMIRPFSDENEDWENDETIFGD